ncbi:MAG: hypothetical protein CVV44_04045 [Spirochaetae bacterium HGW-Spirochaetae-1]|jgi:transcriptional regulator with XRE-family HTH domain|nr:MAG: hypothetical protein CVV44_04045 [Spirochaetae bacterium HGW-Spirochaetae-1]
MNYGDRIAEVMSEYGVSRGEMAKRMKRSESNISQITGRHHLNTETIEMAAEALGVEPIRLLFTDEQIAKYLKMSEEAVRLARAFDKLPEKHNGLFELLIQTIETFYDKNRTLGIQL